MSLVKWLRKNNSKVMAVVVIVIMFGFVGGSYLTYLTRSGPRPRDIVAYFLDGEKIKRTDLQQASRQLDILIRLRADFLLQNQDMQGIFLGELLFAGRSEFVGKPQAVNQIKRTINTNKYSISSKDISNIHDRFTLSSGQRVSLDSAYFWLLLKNEAHRAGIRVANADAGRLLTNVIPQLYQNQVTYRQLIGTLVAGGTSEKQILSTFGDLLAVLQYSHLICSNENVTTSQAKHLASRQIETIDVDFVRIGAEFFAKSQDEPAEEAIVEHFNKYKAIAPATVTAENLYGFGYKFPDRLRLEYIAVKLDDIAKIVKSPTHEETESFYQKKRNLFTENVPEDPNDPNSPMIDRIRGYADVVDIITEQMLRDKIKSKTKAVLQQAKTLTEPNLAGTDLELEELTSEQFRKNARDYTPVVEQLSKEHNVKIYTGKTGLLGAAELQTDKYLGRLSIDGFGYGPVNLTQIVFAVDELGASQLGPFDAPKPRMYENTGPFEGPSQSRFNMSGQIMVVVRIVEAVKALAPSSIYETFSTHSLVLDPNEDMADDDVLSVRKTVTEDVKKLAVIDTTKIRAQEFIDTAGKTDWQAAIDKFNKLYGAQAKDDPNDPNVFVLDYLAAITRNSSLQLNTLAVQAESSASAKFFLNQAEIEGQFTDQLYSLVPADSNTPDKLPVIVEFKPNMSFFCIKDLQVKRLWKEDFDGIRPVSFYRQDFIQFQSLAPVHFKPANILKRMRFRLPEEDKERSDANEPPGGEPAQSEAAT